MNMTTPVVDQLKAWRDAMEAGDIQAAIDHHDAVSAHIKKTSMATPIFEAAGMKPDAFIAWVETKKVLKEQLAKGPEQIEADFDEALEQIDDLKDKLSEARTYTEFIRLAGLMRDAMGAAVTNASCLDDRKWPEDSATDEGDDLDEADEPQESEVEDEDEDESEESDESDDEESDEENG